MILCVPAQHHITRRYWLRVVAHASTTRSKARRLMNGSFRFLCFSSWTATSAVLRQQGNAHSHHPSTLLSSLQLIPSIFPPRFSLSFFTIHVHSTPFANSPHKFPSPENHQQISPNRNDHLPPRTQRTQMRYPARIFSRRCRESQCLVYG